MTLTVEAPPPPVGLAGEASSLVRMVDYAVDVEDVAALLEMTGGLLAGVEALPVGRSDVERKMHARVVSAVRTARIHLSRAGRQVPFERGLVLAAAALAEVAGHLESSGGVAGAGS